MFKRTKYDALVVGARCAGAATAMLMARRGLRVLAIDRGVYGADTMSTHALMRGGVLQLRRWGVLPRLLEVGTPPDRAGQRPGGRRAGGRRGGPARPHLDGADPRPRRARRRRGRARR